MIQGYDEWKATLPEEPKPVAICVCCGCELYEGDYLYTIDDEKLCEECVKDNYRRML